MVSGRGGGHEAVRCAELEWSSLRGTGATCALREKEAELEAARSRLHAVEREEWL